MTSREWIVSIERTPGGYAKLLEQSGSLYVAAWRLARARCMIRSVSTNVPNAAEVYSAACEIVMRTSTTEIIPTKKALKSICESAGYPVV
jgi:hypothetical protein